MDVWKYEIIIIISRLVLNRIYHSFALLTREISWSTLKINFIFLHIHVLLLCIYSIQYYKCYVFVLGVFSAEFNGDC